MPQPKRSRKKAGKPAFELPEPELIVVVNPEAGLRAGRKLKAEEADARPLAKAIDAAKANLQPLFGASEDRLQAEADAAAAASGMQQPDLSVYYRAEGAKDPSALAEEIAALDFVESAYVKPPAEPPTRSTDSAPLAEEPPLATPDFSTSQGYLDAAPVGVDARFAWTRPGGDGTGVNIVDIEGAWRFTHEDLLANQGGALGGMTEDLNWRNHGTAVVGEFGGDRNTLGVTGISPAANTRAISIFGVTSSGQAIKQAADLLAAGDIILIELHRPGPRHGFESREDQLGYIAVEWWDDDFDAIRYATNRGVIVVEAAGNGAENLDDAIYSTRPANFAPGWTNPFNRANRDSGAIMVGAGAPPPGTHGREHGPDRSRLDFSNYGALIDAQGWGREVTTSGYGNLQGGTNEDVWYTDTFSGTSSASPIVVGTLASLQGVARANGQLLTPADCRAHLRATGSPQQPGPGAPVSQRIGNRPDLRALIDAIWVKDKRELKEKPEKFEFKEKEKEKREKIELKEKEKWEHKEKPEKVEFERQRGGVKFEFEGKRGFQFDPRRLRAPGFSAHLSDEEFWSKEKGEKGEKEFKGEQKDKNEKLEKTEKEEKNEKPEKDDPDKNAKGEKWEKDKDEKGEQVEAQEQPGKLGDETGIHQRLARLENLVSHFIDPKLRPDLSEGALTYEPDSPKLHEEAAAAQRSKVAADTKQFET